MMRYTAATAAMTSKTTKAVFTAPMGFPYVGTSVTRALEEREKRTGLAPLGCARPGVVGSDAAGRPRAPTHATCIRTARSRRRRHAAKRNCRVIHVMGGGSRGQAGTVGVLGGIHETAGAHVGESSLDRRQIEKNRAVHPDFDCPGKAAARRDHDFEEHPLSDGNGLRGVVIPPTGFVGVGARGGHVVGAPDERQRKV